MAPSARRTILITGASAGIGAALARTYAAHGWNLILTARREAALEALAGSLATEFGIEATPIVADLAEAGAASRLVRDVEARGLIVDGLVNNAGFSRMSRFLDIGWAEHQAMLRVMLTVPIELNRRLAPGMVARGYGRILNVASVAGSLPATGGDTLYGPIKGFLIKASAGLRLQLRGTGVHVTALCPGYTLTEFHDVNGARKGVSRAYPPWMWSTASDVAEAGYEAMEANRTRVTPGAINVVLAGLASRLPEVWALKLVASETRRRTSV